MTKANIHPPLGTIVDLYFNKKLSSPQIAAQLETTKGVIDYHLRNAGYKLRSISEASTVRGQRTRRRRDIHDEDIERLYFKEELGQTQIAEQLGCSTSLVSTRLKKLGHILRTSGETHKLLYQKGLLEAPKGEQVLTWKGGRIITPSGYVYIHSPEYPGTSSRNPYIAEHRLVWEQAHNKKLPKGYIIHHLNGIKNDNRPSNLVAMKLGEHINQTKPYKQKIRELEIENRQLQRALEDSQMIFYISEN